MKTKAWWMALGLALLGSLQLGAQDSDSVGGITVQTLELAEDVPPVLSARILDAVTGEPLQGVQIRLKGTEIGALSDNSGFVDLSDAQEGDRTLILRLIGFQADSVHIRLDRSTAVHVHAGLRRAHVELPFCGVTAVPADSCDSG